MHLPPTSWPLWGLLICIVGLCLGGGFGIYESSGWRLEMNLHMIGNQTYSSTLMFSDASPSTSAIC